MNLHGVQLSTLLLIESDREVVQFSVDLVFFFFFSSRRRHTRLVSDWSSDVCSSDLSECRALRIVVDAKPDILNHNLETIERLYRLARPGGRYPRALELLRRVKYLDPDRKSVV